MQRTRPTLHQVINEVIKIRIVVGAGEYSQTSAFQSLYVVHLIQGGED